MQGWLEPVQLDGGRGYRATPRAARPPRPTPPTRIYRRGPAPLGRHAGTWCSSTPPRRAQRAQPAARRADVPGVRRARRPASGSARSPAPSSTSVAASAPARPGGTARAADFDADAHRGLGPRRARDVVRRGWPRPPTCWSPSDAGTRTTTTTRRRSRPGSTSCTSGASSSSPTPGCPPSCCPPDWPGQAAAELFTDEAARLKPGADRFVARCLDA